MKKLRYTILSILVGITLLGTAFSSFGCQASDSGSSTTAQTTPDETTNDSTPDDGGNSSTSPDDTPPAGDDPTPDDTPPADDTPPIDEEQVAIVDDAYALMVGEVLGNYTLSGTITSIDEPFSGSYISLYFIVAGRETMPIYCYRMQGEGVELLAVGDRITVYGKIKNYKGTVEFDKNCQLIEYESSTVLPDESADPYKNVSAAEFYASYTVATDNTDAYFRSKHGFMSGNLTVPDQAPTLSAYRPKNGNFYVRNSQMLLSEDGTTYTVVDAYGNEAFEVYRNGAYITLEEVAAYVYAFGSYPKNHSASKNASPSSNIWGKYLRLNHTAFSGDTSRYPYEPVLPNISGCGGTLHYYEMDVGTTGTDCDPSYVATIYNDGYTITRGAARIVYGKQDLNGNGVYEIGEFHVFYTYNHYNDFQEYLNYQGGWGEMFGNITGGGTISSSYNYNPTEYVRVALQMLPSAL